jgi:hypothetical protein
MQKGTGIGPRPNFDLDPGIGSSGPSSLGVKILLASQADACGTIGCRESPTVSVDHPEYGKRVLCDKHALRLLLDPPRGESCPLSMGGRRDQ